MFVLYARHYLLQMGLSALHIAAWKGQAPVVDILVHSGCNIQAQSNNGKTALDLAQEERQVECIRILQTATSKVNVRFYNYKYSS